MQNILEEIQKKAVVSVCKELAEEYGSRAETLEIMIERACLLALSKEFQKSYKCERVAAYVSIIAKNKKEYKK